MMNTITKLLCIACAVGAAAALLGLRARGSKTH